MIPFLQIFAHKVCTGVLAANNKPIHKRSVEQYLRSVGQIFAAVGAPDPRLNSMAPSTFTWNNSLQPTRKNILPPEEYTPSPSPSSTAWTQPPKAAPPDTTLSQTSPGSLSSFYSDPGNTTPAAPIPSPPPSPCATSSYLSSTNLSKPPRLQPPPAPPPPLLSSSLRFRKMVSKGNPSDTGQRYTPKHVQWRPFGAMWHIYNNMAPPQTRTLPPISTEQLGPPSAVPKSPQHCAPQPLSWDPRWDSRQKTSAHDRCGPVAPWPSSWHVSTQTRSALWVGGTATSCCANST